MEQPIFYDISVELDENTIVYPSDHPPIIEKVCSIERGNLCNVSKMTLSCHTGTHIDAPYHFLGYGKKISEFDLSSFILNTIVLESSSNNEINASDIPDKLPDNIEAILFKTNNSRNSIYEKKTFTADYVSVSVEVAEKCVSIGIKLVGIDYLSVDKYETTQYPAHYLFMNKNILILETINLKDVSAGRYKLICLPLRIKNTEASPVRAVLISEN